MTLPQTFQIGDRVCMRRKANGLTKGLSGTVVRVVVGTECCDIQFEGYTWPRLVYCYDLELVEHTQVVG
jgi:hypothetical protein